MAICDRMETGARRRRAFDVESEPSAFQADLHIESAGLVSKMYRVNDDYRARMGEQFCASTVTIHAEEGKRRRDTNITFAEGKAHTPSAT